MGGYIQAKIIKVLSLGLLLLTVPLIFGIACYGSTPSPAPAPASPATQVEISGFAFKPATITIAAGATITWVNKDSATHTVTARDGQFDSGRLSQGDTFSYTFTQRGTYQYYCTIHPKMTGTITVE
ncbi:MAG TPA: cupredoxin family copper-binding protein [Dehalococcoidia bacterium]|jgi:plastocyanin|nr:cupredoxin family copper-binding protein [Dehalococcoidia bacterium]